MPSFKLCRFLGVLAASALVAPAWSQSFYHAPPLPSQDLAQLPIIRPAVTAAAKPRVEPMSAPTPPAAAPMPPAPAPAPPDLNVPTPQVPAHLSSNLWKRLPAAPAAIAAPPALQTAATQGAEPKPPAPPAEHPSVIKPTPDPDHLRSVAVRSMARGDVEAAEKQLAMALERFPNDVRLAIALARLRETRGDWNGAIAAFDVVIRLEPAEPRWKTRRAECRYFNEDFSNAVADYQAAESASAPLTVSEYIRFGDAALRTNQPERAEAAFAAVSRLAKDPIPQVELLRGLAALKRGDGDQARTILLRANAIWPDDPSLTEALRVASLIRRGSAIETAQVLSNRGVSPSAHMPDAAATDPTPAAPVTSRWRAARTQTVASVVTTSGETEQAEVAAGATSSAVEAIGDASIEQKNDGWRPTAAKTRDAVELQPDDGVPLSSPGVLAEPGPLPLP